MKRLLLTTTAVLGLAAAACAPRSAADPGAAPRYAALRVENQGIVDVNVFAFRNGQRERLGMVRGMSTATLRIPDRLIFGPTPLRFRAEPVAGRGTPTTQQIVVSPGDTLVWILR
jgi:hypothetical protein